MINEKVVEEIDFALHSVFHLVEIATIAVSKVSLSGRCSTGGSGSGQAEPVRRPGGACDRRFPKDGCRCSTGGSGSGQAESTRRFRKQNVVGSGFWVRGWRAARELEETRLLGRIENGATEERAREVSADIKTTEWT
ncbi:hypothetical protein EAI_16551 [Harpegnathos saltator]|uniref:Uncharacterized protein n=1 Tax=Harpegnathos saltator TaxID=610380 RepID=E2C3B9_HARSA|nr:hypothetical protein EAI_16551 [Harpegnathos saltator]